MKMKCRFTGRGGQGIKFVGGLLAKVGMAANYYASVATDYTPSVRGGPIFSDAVISDEPVAFPHCDKDATFFIALDRKGFERAKECVCETTVSLVDANTIGKELASTISEGKVYLVPFTATADKWNMSKSANVIALGFLAEVFLNNPLKQKLPDLKEEHFLQIFDGMSPNLKNMNLQAFQLGRDLYHDVFG